MSAHHAGPRAGSRAYIALEVLHSIGGHATASTWMDNVKWTLMVRAQSVWDNVVASLLNTRLIYQRANVYIVSDDGLAWLGIAADAPPLEARPVAGPRYAPSDRPLSAKHIPDVRMMREGAFDYRDIPSRIGDQYVAHGTKA